MDKDFDALIKNLPQDRIEELLKKYAAEDEKLREEILSNPSFKDPSFNDLALKEWQRRIDDAIEEDLAGDIDDYYASKTVNWDTTISILTDAVIDLMKRGRLKMPPY